MGHVVVFLIYLTSLRGYDGTLGIAFARLCISDETCSMPALCSLENIKL